MLGISSGQKRLFEAIERAWGRRRRELAFLLALPLQRKCILHNGFLKRPHCLIHCLMN